MEPKCIKFCGRRCGALGANLSYCCNVLVGEKRGEKRYSLGWGGKVGKERRALLCLNEETLDIRMIPVMSTVPSFPLERMVPTVIWN